MMMIQGHFLVRASRKDDSTNDDHDHDSHDHHYHPYRPMLVTDTSISFWGGIDPVTGQIIDTSHPLWNIQITNTNNTNNTHLSHDQIFCIPSSRGSCTTSQVVLELILNHRLPQTIIVRDVHEALLCIGVIIAQEFFPNH